MCSSPSSTGDRSRASTARKVCHPRSRTTWRWFLVRAADAPSDPRNVALGVRLAQAAVKAEPRNGGFRNTLGVALYRAGDWTRAIAELDESVRIWNGDQGYSYDGFFLAMAHWRLGEELKALAYFDRSVHSMKRQAQSPAELVQFRAEAEALLDLSRPRPDFRKVVGDFSAVTYLQTGRASGDRGEWAAALADLRRVFELGGGGRGETSDPITDPSMAWLNRAVLEVEFGDRGAYREHCRRMVERFEGSTNAGELERTAKAGLFDPPPSWEEAARLRSLARSAVERAGPDDPYRSWYLLALGLAEYRAGDFDAALKVLDRHQAPGGAAVIMAASVQAMAVARKGQSQAAQGRLAQAERLLAEQVPTMAAPDWDNRLIARRLVREAAALIRFDPIFPADPFAR